VRLKLELSLQAGYLTVQCKAELCMLVADWAMKRNCFKSRLCYMETVMLNLK